jgi:23S rRNA (cytosine1962-C5)-methyltransferase
MTAERRIGLRVTPEAERRVRQGHPWLYETAIRRQSEAGKPGDLAVIYDRRDRFLAVGLYDPGSLIRVRILQRHRPSPIDRGWFEARLAEAVRLREPLRASSTTGYRLVHGENDGLPGLVVDRYDETLVVKLYSAAWAAHLRELLPALAAVWPAARLVLRLSRAVQHHPPALHDLEDGVVLAGPPLRGPVVFSENGLHFEADPVHGQKTGFFLDQRENRAKAGALTKGASVLDAFAYTGGFSVYAAYGGAREVTSVDVSRPVLEAAKRNMARNRDHPAVRAAAHRLILGDAFDRLAELARANERFDVVILDPPAFAGSRAEVPQALSAYARLTRLGLGVLRPGGTLMLSSCSGQVSEKEFFAAIHYAASQVKRPLKELARTGHPLDHPVRFAEGAYLKCLFARAPGARTDKLRR